MRYLNERHLGNSAKFHSNFAICGILLNFVANFVQAIRNSSKFPQSVHSDNAEFRFQWKPLDNAIGLGAGSH